MGVSLITYTTHERISLAHNLSLLMHAKPALAALLPLQLDPGAARQEGRQVGGQQQTEPRARRGLLPHRSAHARVRRPSTGWGDTNVADGDKRWQDMNPDEQAVVIRQINGAVNGLQFRIQDLEDAVKALQERLKR